MPESKYRQQTIRAPRGTVLTAKSWLTEAPLRMLMNNLDPDVAENPHELVVYGGIGRARATGNAMTLLLMRSPGWRRTKRCLFSLANRSAYLKRTTTRRGY